MMTRRIFLTLPLLFLLLALTALPCLAQAAAPLISSAAPASVALNVQPGLYQAEIEVTQATTVTLFCPNKPGVISFSGLTKATEVAYDQKAQTLTLSLQPGRYKLAIRPL
ncbi:MAG: hypothetical protein ACYC63_12385 [Armatimonadota bacterium]